MALNRRHCLSLVASLPLMPWMGLAHPKEASSQPHVSRLFSARGDGRGGYWVSAMDPAGVLGVQTSLPGRGHGIAVHPRGHQALCFARRPGDFFVVLGLSPETAAEFHHTPEDRHLYGHGVFSRDGDLLYTTENAMDQDTGCIGVWDTGSGYRRVGEFPTHGIGPHELLLSPDGERLIVANGGILTRPETGRTKLNLDTMDSSLVVLDRHRGKLLERHRLSPDLHRLSIRHLAMGRDGVLCAALQYQGAGDENPPLVAFSQPGGALEPKLAPEPAQRAMHQYCGGVAVDLSGDWFAVSAPRGNLVTFWGFDGTFHSSTVVSDGCGVAPGERPGTFYLSSGHGGVYHHDIDSNTTRLITRSTDAQWDNHLTRA